MTRETAPAPAAGTCATCDAVLTGPYCASCGQRVLGGRHTLRGLAAGAVARLFNLERGLTHTAIQLTAAPGAVIRGYLAGRTVPYVNPAAYLILALALFTVVSRLLMMVTGGDDRLFLALIVFFLAAASRVLFLRAGLNYVEHLIMNMYLFGHVLLLVTVAQPILYLLPDRAMRPALVVLLPGVVSYFGWAYSRVFRSRPTVGAFLGAIVTVLGTVLWFIGLGTLLNLIRGS